MPGPYSVHTRDGNRHDNLDQGTLRLWHELGRVDAGSPVLETGAVEPRRLDQVFDLATWVLPEVPRQHVPPLPPPPVAFEPAFTPGLGLRDCLLVLVASLPIGLYGLIRYSENLPVEGGANPSLAVRFALTLALLGLFGGTFLAMRLRWNRGLSALVALGALVVGGIFLQIGVIGVLKFQQFSREAQAQRRASLAPPVPAAMETFTVARAVRIKAPIPFTMEPEAQPNSNFQATWKYTASTRTCTVVVWAHTLKPGYYFMPSKCLDGVLTAHQKMAEEVFSTVPPRAITLEGGPAYRSDVTLRLRNQARLSVGHITMLAFGSPRGVREPREGIVVMIASETGDLAKDDQEIEALVASVVRLK